MVKIFFVSLIYFLSTSCNEEQKSSLYKINVTKTVADLKTVILKDSADSGLNFQVKNSYRNEKHRILKERLKLKQAYFLLKDTLDKEQFLDSVSIVFSDLLLNNIIPHWYGTPWDFEGHTSVPNQGEIACGYFVSTTLNHMGLNLNRYHLARQGPLNEAKSLAIDTNFVLEFNSENLRIKNEFFTSFSNGLYFVGLDSHVGYLYVYKEHAFFIHSNYMENRVMLETIENSEAFKSYSYCLVKVTGNINLMKKWILEGEIQVYKS